MQEAAAGALSSVAALVAALSSPSLPKPTFKNSDEDQSWSAEAKWANEAVAALQALAQRLRPRTGQLLPETKLAAAFVRLEPNNVLGSWTPATLGWGTPGRLPGRGGALPACRDAAAPCSLPVTRRAGSELSVGPPFHR